MPQIHQRPRRRFRFRLAPLGSNSNVPDDNELAAFRHLRHQSETHKRKFDKSNNLGDITACPISNDVAGIAGEVTQPNLKKPAKCGTIQRQQKQRCTTFSIQKWFLNSRSAFSTDSLYNMATLWIFIVQS
jgi:hypothetical protein